eukprot:TRINITY_DN1913_c0_g1_i1.p1 TRINITY_DN1913_c0_g1~~TRINITY_DN1913_c0_g1_i1.p1  ORF type:complete len:315 (+),score=93.63 TRINITY_DN1913_c0_g1_i1:3-947(+)
MATNTATPSTTGPTTTATTTTTPQLTNAINAVHVKSVDISTSSPVRGYNYKEEGGIDYEELLKSYMTTGFQATSFGQAVDEINRMIKWRLSDEPINPDVDTDDLLDPSVRQNIKCKIFLGYTSNLVSSGVRETIKFLVKNKMVDVIVTTAGGIEEDFIKCLANTYVGDFHIPGPQLRLQGLNRIGNLIIPNDNYCKFEDWVMPILDKMVSEQKTRETPWTPSELIDRLGQEINNEDSIYYWAHKNKIPVFSPAITDGSLGDMIYFHSYQNPGLVLDLVGDIRKINNQAVYAKHTGMIILGGGIIKHHICNANLF